jgi:hypothetical protein
MNWIEINEDKTNLPEDGVDVLVTYDIKEMQIMYNDTEINKFRNFDGVIYSLERVTAWIPLPEPFKKI